MSKYDTEYFFILKAEDERLPSLTADETTIERNYSFEAQPMGSPPLRFFNGAKEYDEKMKIRPLAEPPRFLFNGTNVLAPARVREALLEAEVPNLSMHPAVYVHDNRKWYEDYWLLTFTQRFDCWDRATSTYEDEPLEMGGFKLFSIYTYSLDAELLNRTPLRERLLFKMGGSQDAFVVCHRSIASLFRGHENGVRMVAVSDY